MAQTVTLKGVVRDQAGERLPSAYVFIYPDSVNIATSNDGRFSKALPRGKKTIIVSFVGHEIYRQTFFLKRDTT
ncbi:MAG TPA: carboxypeptidase-like regulatory domain-containing protein, partial [Niabella sp.]|nr:carboxypeptidase-like regulatory domain-containing protein [Niabella sp.]